MKQSDIFKKAWQIARQSVMNFGGESIQYFSEALKQAYKMAKTHCKVSRFNWNFGIIDSYITITSPKGNTIKIYKDMISNHSELSKMVLNIAKKSVVLLTPNQMQSLLTLSNQKF